MVHASSQTEGRGLESFLSSCCFGLVYCSRCTGFSSARQRSKAFSLLSKLQLFRLLNQSLSSPKNSASKGDTHRVPIQEYQQNLQKIQEAFPYSKILFFAFPQKEPAKEWVSIIQAFPNLKVHDVSSDWFFPEDEIHLTPIGHKKLALSLKASLVDASILPPSN